MRHSWEIRTDHMKERRSNRRYSTGKGEEGGGLTPRNEGTEKTARWSKMQGFVSRDAGIEKTASGEGHPRDEDRRDPRIDKAASGEGYPRDGDSRIRSGYESTGSVIMVTNTKRSYAELAKRNRKGKENSQTTPPPSAGSVVTSQRHHHHDRRHHHYQERIWWHRDALLCSSLQQSFIGILGTSCAPGWPPEGLQMASRCRLRPLVRPGGRD